MRPSSILRGYARGHKIERFTEWQIGLAWMPRDRYVACEAGGGTGYLQTRGFVLEGRELRADADVRGYLRVGATEGRGELLPGLG